MEVSLSVIAIFFKEERKVLLQFLESLYSTITSVPFEVVFINNSQEVVDEARSNYSNIQIIDNKENLGVASSRNQAVSFAKGKTLLFIDSDVIVKPYTIDSMYRYVQDNPQIGVIAPKIVFPDGRLQYNFDGLPNKQFPFYELFNIPVRARNTNISAHQTNFLSGCCFMLNKTTWENVGPFDEHFSPYGWEDADWCKRALDKNVVLYYYPEVSIIHLLHKSSKSTGARQVEFYISALYYAKKHFGSLYAFFLKWFIILFSLLRVGVSFFKPGRASLRVQLFRLIKRII